MVYGLNNELFFAEFNLDRTQIFRLDLEGKVLRAQKKKVYDLECYLIAIQPDASNDVMELDKSTLFVLSSDQKVHRIQASEKDSRVFECIERYNFEGYNMRGLTERNWSSCHISPGAITYDEFVF